MHVLESFNSGKKKKDMAEGNRYYGFTSLEKEGILILMLS